MTESADQRVYVIAALQIIYHAAIGKGLGSQTNGKTIW